jgi:methyl-accepting chemotaxis protein
MNDKSGHATLAFFNLTGVDFARFGRIARMMQKHGGKALDRLYDKIGTTPETARQFSSRRVMDHAPCQADRTLGPHVRRCAG